MRGRYRGFWISGGLLALAACGKASDRAPAAPASPAAAVTAAAGAPVAADTETALDSLVTPRQPGSYAPRDECGGLPSARGFREALAAAVEKRDAEAIAAMAIEDVRLDFGGGHGRTQLLAKLRENDGELMRELGELLPLGCAATEGGGLTIPWYFAQNFGDVDTYAAMLATGSDVPLHAAADSSSEVKQRLSWELVTLDDGLHAGQPFQQVTTVDGAKGFMPTAKLRSLLDYRLLAIRQADGWKITAILAGGLSRPLHASCDDYRPGTRCASAS